MKYIAYRNLIGVSHTEAEAKAEGELDVHIYSRRMFSDEEILPLQPRRLK